MTAFFPMCMCIWCVESGITSIQAGASWLVDPVAGAQCVPRACCTGSTGVQLCYRTLTSHDSCHFQGSCAPPAWEVLTGMIHVASAIPWPYANIVIGMSVCKQRTILQSSVVSRLHKLRCLDPRESLQSWLIISREQQLQTAAQAAS